MMAYKLIIENDIENIQWRLECELVGKGRADEVVKSVTLTGISKITGKEYKAVMDSSTSDITHDGFFEHICQRLVDDIGSAEWFLRGSVVTLQLGLWNRLRLVEVTRTISP